MWKITTSGTLSLASSESPQSPHCCILDALQLNLSVKFQVNKSCARELNLSRCGSQMSDFDFVYYQQGWLQTWQHPYWEPWGRGKSVPSSSPSFTGHKKNVSKIITHTDLFIFLLDHNYILLWCEHPQVWWQMQYTITPSLLLRLDMFN